MLRFSLLIIFFIGIPSIAHGAIRITEVAWMGTPESQFGEWVELYNDGEESVDLSGWKLYEAGGDTLVFTFTKTIPSQGYLILERTTASSLDPLPSINDESGTFGGSGFSNSGESLVVKNADGETVQTLAFSGGWPAGDSESKHTMQTSTDGWITSAPTPGSGTATPSTVQTSSAPVSSGGGSWVPPKVEPRVELTIPKYIYTTITYDYEAQTFLDYGPAYSGGFVWNMGDGTVYKSMSPQPVRHTYQYPGTYSISFGFYKNYYDTKPFFFETIERTVAEPTLLFSVISGKGFEFSNKSSHSVDISGWMIDLGDRFVLLPPLSLIASKATIIMPFSQFEIPGTYTTGVLKTPEGRLVGGSISKEDETIIIPATITSSRLTPDIRESVRGVTVAQAESSEEILTQAITSPETKKPQKNYTKTIFLGVVLLIVIGLFLLLERFMAQKE